jgi:hypothetical protein
MNDFASFAERPLQPHIAALGCFHPLPPTSGATSHTAQTMSQPPAPVGLQRRALRMFPHKKLARQRYLKAHEDLRKNLIQSRGN